MSFKGRADRICCGVVRSKIQQGGDFRCAQQDGVGFNHTEKTLEAVSLGSRISQEFLFGCPLRLQDKMSNRQLDVQREAQRKEPRSEP